MDSILQLSPKQRSELFIAAAQQSGIDVVVLEKDFWVCWTLKELFRLPTMGEHLIFKGGTSLSKVFKIINRFSEDIDVSIDRGFLGYGGVNEPEAGASNKEKQRRVEGLMAACQQKIADELTPALRGAIQEKIPRADNWSLLPDESDPDKTFIEILGAGGWAGFVSNDLNKKLRAPTYCQNINTGLSMTTKGTERKAFSLQQQTKRGLG